MDNQPVLSKAEGPVQGQNTGVPQTPAPPTPIPPPPAVQPPQTPPSGPEALRAGGPKSRKKILFLLLLVVLIAIVAGYFFLSSKKPGPELAAKVGDRQITVSQVDEFAGACELEQKEAVEYLVDNIVLEQWAQDEKITFSKEDQKAEEIRISGKEAAINCIAVQAKVNLLREKLSQNTEKYREGKFIYINFGLYANPDPMMAPPGVDNEEERLAKLNEDKSAADNLIQSIHQDLKANKLTFEQAIEKVNSNPKFGVATSSAVIKPGDSFTADDYIGKRNLLGDETVRKKIDELSEGKFSEPFIQKVNISLCQILETDCPAEYVDSAWVIVKVEKIGKGYEESGEKLLLKIREKHNAKIFLK